MSADGTVVAYLRTRGIASTRQIARHLGTFCLDARLQLMRLDRKGLVERDSARSSAGNTVWRLPTPNPTGASL